MFKDWKTIIFVSLSILVLWFAAADDGAIKDQKWNESSNAWAAGSYNFVPIISPDQNTINQIHPAAPEAIVDNLPNTSTAPVDNKIKIDLDACNKDSHDCDKLTEYLSKKWYDYYKAMSDAKSMPVNDDLKSQLESTVDSLLTWPCKPPYLCDFVRSVVVRDADGNIVNQSSTNDKKNYVWHVTLIKQ